MIKTSESINDAKSYINSLKGKRLYVKVNLGRNKTISYIGTLSGVYPALFTVSPLSPVETFRGKTSFSYSELLCGGVRIKEKAE